VHASFEFKIHVNRWDSEDGDAGLLEWLAAYPGKLVSSALKLILRKAVNFVLIREGKTAET
jgi:hypothetical protein